MARSDIFALARQATGQGTPDLTPDYYVPAEGVDPDVDRETIAVEETSGDRFPTGLEYGTRFFTINARLAPRMNSLPRLLSAWMGQPTTGAPVSGVYPHVFDPTVAGKQPEWHTIAAVRSDPTPAIVDFFTDCRGDRFTLTFAANDAPRLNGTLIGIGLDDTQSAPTPTHDTSERQKFHNALVYLDDGGGEAVFACAVWALEYGNNLDTDNAVLGSRELYALPFGNADAQVTFSPRVDLSDHYRRALLEDPASIKVRLIADNGLAGALHRQVEVIVPALETVSAPAPIDGSSVLKMVEVTARAKKNESDGKFCTVTVRNAVATY